MIVTNADDKPVNESFISRWSRLKREPHSDDGKQATGNDAVEPGTAAGKQEAAPLPSIDDLDENSDFSAFLNPAVDEELRKLALRKLFRLPDFNLRDGLNEYDEDYTGYHALGETVTREMKRAMKLAAATMDGAMPDTPDTTTLGQSESDESLAPQEADAGLPVDGNPDPRES